MTPFAKALSEIPAGYVYSLTDSRGFTIYTHPSRTKPVIYIAPDGTVSKIDRDDDR